MCKAHILRFCCGHGLLMSIESCPMCPCPIIKTTGVRLPQQPFKCYNCQYKQSSTTLSPTSTRDTSCTSSIGSLDSTTSTASTASTASSTFSISTFVAQKPTHPLPGVARQPPSSVQYPTSPLTLSRTSTCTLRPSKPTTPAHLRRTSTSLSVCSTATTSHTRQSSSKGPFKFACTSHNHPLTPHYTLLPPYLPHQDHACPPCQIESLRAAALSTAAKQAKSQFPHLTADMLMLNGRPQQNCQWIQQLTCESYVEERCVEERQCWWGVGRKWVQDLKKCRVLVAEEDGLGLLN